MINEFEDRILRFARLWCVSQDREAVAVRANDQVLREAAVYLPTGPSEAVFYGFSVHAALPTNHLAYRL